MLARLFAVLSCLALVALAGQPPRPAPGMLIKVTITGEVGVLLDDLPADTVARAVSYTLTRPQAFWREAAYRQIVFTRYRLIYRPYYYNFNQDGEPTVGQLPIPYDQLTFQFTCAPTRKTFQGHDLITRTYIAEAFIVTDQASGEAADPSFRGSGSGVVNEIFNLPMDPYLVYQRTGPDCMNEAGYPLGSIDGENPEYLYDDSCGPEPPYVEADGPCFGCHCTFFTNRSCVDSLKANVGASTVKVNYKKLRWDEEFARSIEALSPYNLTFAGGADLIPSLPDLRHNYVGYQFFKTDSCTNKECGGTPGWRRILYFDASNVNVGGKNMEIGVVDYIKADPTSFDPDKFRNLYTWDTCHQHPHFAAYAAYNYGNLVGRKQGFCIQTTGRDVNARWAPLITKSYTCDFQGVESGWSDAYQAGMPCQWVDVTDVNTRTRSATQTLSLTSNPKNWLCEGTIINLPNGSRDWVPTGDFTATGQSIDKYNCSETPGARNNNQVTTQVTLPTDGNGILTSACIYRGHNLGPKRDCEFSLRTQLDRCTPGSRVNLVCSIPSRAASQVIRVCESSIALRSGLACRFNEDHLLANVVLRPGVNTPVSFTCPGAREGVEVGGVYSTYTGPAFNGGDAAAAITCRVV